MSDETSSNVTLTYRTGRYDSQQEVSVTGSLIEQSDTHVTVGQHRVHRSRIVSLIAAPLRDESEG